MDDRERERDRERVSSCNRTLPNRKTKVYLATPAIFTIKQRVSGCRFASREPTYRPLTREIGPSSTRASSTRFPETEGSAVSHPAESHESGKFKRETDPFGGWFAH